MSKHIHLVWAFDPSHEDHPHVVIACERIQDADHRARREAKATPQHEVRMVRMDMHRIPNVQIEFTSGGIYAGVQTIAVRPPSRRRGVSNR